MSKTKRHPWLTPLALAFVLKSYRQVTPKGAPTIAPQPHTPAAAIPSPGVRAAAGEWTYPAPHGDYRLSVSGHEPAYVGGCSCKAGAAGRPCYHAAGLALRLWQDGWAADGLDYDVELSLSDLMAEYGEDEAARIVLTRGDGVAKHLPRYGHPKNDDKEAA